ncbi:MAG TPA: cell envelope integrity protein TolA [Xanthobacteraceae bacterium]
MRTLACVAGLTACLAAAGLAPAFADDELSRKTEDRLAHLPHPASRLGIDDIQKLRTRLAVCWDVPAELRNRSEATVTIRISLNVDGSLAVPPVVTNHSQHPLFAKAAESAIRAVRKCAPFTFLPTAAYDQWKIIEVNFDPHEMMR